MLQSVAKMYNCTECEVFHDWLQCLSAFTFRTIFCETTMQRFILVVSQQLHRLHPCILDIY